jgi:hypothetical protein
MWSLAEFGGGRYCAGRPLPSGGRGRRFKSSHSDQYSPVLSVAYVRHPASRGRSARAAEALRKRCDGTQPPFGPKGSPRPDTPHAHAREGQAPLPPQPSAGSLRPSPRPGPRRPDREAQRGFRVPSGPDAGPGAGLSPTGGLGSHKPRGGTRTDPNPGILQRDQRVEGNSLTCPLGATGTEGLSHGGARGCAPSALAAETQPKPP